MTTLNLKPTTEKLSFFENVEFNLEMLNKKLPELELEYNLEKNITKKTNVMMQLLDVERLIPVYENMLK